MFDSCPIRREPVHLTLYSDASLEGWGGTDEVTHVGGRWTEAEMPYHINALELQAAYLTFRALGVPHKNVHLRLMLDNATATTYINKMGGGGAHIPWFVTLLPKPFGNGPFLGTFFLKNGTGNYVEGVVNDRTGSGPVRSTSCETPHDTFKIASWNIGTMRGRSSEIVETITRRNIDLCCVQEVRWRGASARHITGKDSR